MAYSTAWGRINGGEPKINKRNNRREVEEVLRANIMSCSIWQERPNTAVNLVAKYNNKEYQAYGWGKVQYPDKWDADYGVELVINKAIAKISKEIANNEQCCSD